MTYSHSVTVCFSRQVEMPRSCRQLRDRERVQCGVGLRIRREKMGCVFLGGLCIMCASCWCPMMAWRCLHNLRLYGKHRNYVYIYTYIIHIIYVLLPLWLIKTKDTQWLHTTGTSWCLEGFLDLIGADLSGQLSLLRKRSWERGRPRDLPGISDLNILIYLGCVSVFANMNQWWIWTTTQWCLTGLLPGCLSASVILWPGLTDCDSLDFRLNGTSPIKDNWIERWPEALWQCPLCGQFDIVWQPETSVNIVNQMQAVLGKSYIVSLPVLSWHVGSS